MDPCAFKFLTVPCLQCSRATYHFIVREQWHWIHLKRRIAALMICSVQSTSESSSRNARLTCLHAYRVERAWRTRGLRHTSHTAINLDHTCQVILLPGGDSLLSLTPEGTIHMQRVPFGDYQISTPEPIMAVKYANMRYNAELGVLMVYLHYSESK